MHQDLTDEEQTIRFPGVETNASSETTGDHTGAVSEKETIIDEVTYTNLIAGKEYTVNGTLMNKETGEAMKDADGKEITASTTFTAEKSDGTVQLKYVVDSSLLVGQTVVVFEELYHEGVKIASHADLTDEDQSVHFPKIGTVANVNNTHYAQASDSTTLVDTVNYENLVVGDTYIISGTVMDKETGKTLLNAKGETVTAVRSFTAEKSNGSIELTFKLDTSTLTGKTLVVFEDLYHNGQTVTKHEDLEDADQSVDVIDIHTSAVDAKTGEHSAKASEETEIIDAVYYEGLTPGKKYTVKGRLMNKKTGKAIKGAAAEAEFTPEDRSGTVSLTFTVNTSKLAGNSVVAFEKLYEFGSEYEIATHEDLRDKDQTVKITTPGAPPKTGDTGKNVLLWIVLIVAACGAAAGIRRKNRKGKGSEDAKASSDPSPETGNREVSNAEMNAENADIQSPDAKE